MSELIAALEARRGQIATYTNCDFIPTAEYHALIDLAVADERLRQAQLCLKNADFDAAAGVHIPHNARMVLIENLIDAADDRDRAVAALTRHLTGDATTAQDGAGRTGDAAHE